MKQTAFRSTALAAALLGCSALTTAPASAQEPVEITFFIWAGSNQGVVPMEVIDAYKKENPHVTINILESNNTITYPKMVAARRTTPDDPLVHCGFFNVDSMTKGDVDDMWESLDPALVPNMEKVIEKFRRPDNRGVGYQMSGIGILYNKDAVKEPPTSWSAMWSEEYRGRVTMFDYDTRMMVVASMLNGGDERNMDPGFQTWSDNAENLKALVDSNDALKNLLVAGDAWIAPWFSSLAHVWIEEGAPLGFAVPDEGAIAFPIFLTVANGVDDAERKVCSDLVNTLLSPENAGRYGQLTFSIPVVEGASATEEQENDPTLNLDLAKDAIVPDYSHIAEMTPDWRQRWDREVKFKLR
ncbi:extracellular solute-binding protein [Mesorhizobium sp. Z1-4]|uniref:ABC transporter substrate-binding protein n=1 Tax=Mesorhizobium sp. Z1-4 TaxID=2448478 RepID=UPI000FD92607|nr:extracellular solute-binding protein [Mesorhizobium sp. Z1-4]